MTYPAEGTPRWKSPLEIAIHADIAAETRAREDADADLRHTVATNVVPVTFNDGTTTYTFESVGGQLIFLAVDNATGAYSSLSMSALGGGAILLQEIDGNHFAFVEAVADPTKSYINLVADGAATHLYICDGTPNAVINAPKGSIAVDRFTPALYQNTDGVTAWSLVGGGGLPTITQSVTVGPNAPFRVDFDFDLGGLCVAYVKATLTAFNADGETKGFAGGQIAADAHAVIVSDDPSFVTYPNASNGSNALGLWLEDDPVDVQALPYTSHRMRGTCERYMRVTMDIIDGSSFDPYAGANHPTATWTIEIQRA